ncbi:MAG TPA: 7-cyano-7-deazaguanine synthase [Candidatus Dormibacteraeota bacterium]|nr:7-cyano-7-deazaguanine synthase [Candidatus Dormibacteraeota bacterium]
MEEPHRKGAKGPSGRRQEALRARSVFVRRGGKQTGGCSIVLEAGSNLQTGERKFLTIFGGLTTLEADLLLIASSIFAADRCLARGEREDFARGVEISIPVINAGLLQPLGASLEELLRTLSNDAWRVSFRQESGEPETQPVAQPAQGATLLFSGGLDSLAAAIELGTTIPSLQLVSHTTRNQRTSVTQDELIALLKTIGIAPPHRKFQVSATSKEPAANISFDTESSQRTRSFLFLTLGVLCARRAGHTDVVYLAENGQMAIHLPLTSARIGAFSTHTAHPDVLARAKRFFNHALRTDLHIANPYVHKTKAEVTRIVLDKLPSAIPKTISCWKTSRLVRQATHCGACIPCIVRRVAIEFHGADPTIYERDLFAESFASLNEADDGRRNLADFAEFTMRIERSLDIDIMAEWPDLYSPQILRSEAIGMYRRACAEARNVLSKYPNLAPILA